MLILTYLLIQIIVTPYIGVWIEIGVTAGTDGRKIGHSLHRSVD